MELWRPPHDRPHLFDWWRPLVLASQRARCEGLPWPIHIDEFQLRGRVDRGGGKPSVWVYGHAQAGGELYVDDTGATYRFVETPNGRSPGRFTPCDVRSAVRAVGLASLVRHPSAHSPGETRSAPVFRRYKHLAVVVDDDEETRRDAG